MKTWLLVVLSIIALGLTPIIGESVLSQNAGNVTAPAVPQGTSVEVTGGNLTENVPETSAGNVTAPAVPQGTSVEVTGGNLTEDVRETSAGNISEPLAPG
jgi:hypothetical protein